MMLRCFWLVVILLASCAAVAKGPETVQVRSGSKTLGAYVWRPAGRGPFPAVLLIHGSGRTREDLDRLGPYERQAEPLGQVFARHGYLFVYLFRRGVGLSADQGTSAVELMTREGAEHGQEARNALQLTLLQGQDMDDTKAGLAYLRALPDVDTHRISAVGHSFGGSLTVLLAESEPSLRAFVVFSAAGYSWDRSPPLRERLLAALARAAAPIFFIHAANDYSLTPGQAMDARLRELGKPHRLMIYPAVGRTPDDGHGFMYNPVGAWEADVFRFLDEAQRAE
jgi:carboxymethylenebutenolidase